MPDENMAMVATQGLYGDRVSGLTWGELRDILSRVEAISELFIDRMASQTQSLRIILNDDDRMWDELPEPTREFFREKVREVLLTYPEKK
jgi:hypothetical protein